MLDPFAFQDVLLVGVLLDRVDGPQFLEKSPGTCKSGIRRPQPVERSVPPTEPHQSQRRRHGFLIFLRQISLPEPRSQPRRPGIHRIDNDILSKRLSNHRMWAPWIPATIRPAGRIIELPRVPSEDSLSLSGRGLG